MYHTQFTSIIYHFRDYKKEDDKELLIYTGAAVTDYMELKYGNPKTAQQVKLTYTSGSPSGFELPVPRYL